MISIVQLHILVCLPNRMATILQEICVLLCSGSGGGSDGGCSNSIVLSVDSHGTCSSSLC